jgi:hypothetical protein
MGYKHFCLDGRELLAESEVMAIALTSGLLLAVSPGFHGIERRAGLVFDPNVIAVRSRFANAGRTQGILHTWGIKPCSGLLPCLFVGNLRTSSKVHASGGQTTLGVKKDRRNRARAASLKLAVMARIREAPSYSINLNVVLSWWDHEFSCKRFRRQNE